MVAVVAEVALVAVVVVVVVVVLDTAFKNASMSTASEHYLCNVSPR